MKCPRDGGAVVRPPGPLQRVERCLDCGGVFIGAGTLRGMIAGRADELGPGRLLSRLAEAGSQGNDAATCPADGKAMTRFGFRGVDIDVCGHCLGVWLDPGELEKLSGQSAPRVPETLLPAVAVAVRVVLVPSGTTVPLDGDDMETVGTDAATVTATADEVTAAPFESVTRAVRETLPAADGVQEYVKGVEDTEASSVVPEKNSTLLTVAGATGVAVAVRVALVPNTMAVPAVGAVRETEGPVTLTLTAVEVAVAPLESVTRAVNAVTPAADGVQVTV